MIFKPNFIIKNKLIIGFVYVCFIATQFSCTSKGEDDPWLSFRTRDNRLKNDWKLDQMENTFEVTTTQAGTNRPVQLLISTTFNGNDMRFKTVIDNQVVLDTLIGYSFVLKIEEEGALNYEFVNFLGGIGVKSSGEDNWFWASDDRKKSKVNLGQAMLRGVTAGNDISPLSNFNLEEIFQVFDITELRKDELSLQLNKRQLTTNLNGSIQELKISHISSFVNN